MKIKKYQVKEKLPSTLADHKESEKSLIMRQYVIGKLLSQLMRDKALKMLETTTEDGDVYLSAEIEVNLNEAS